MLKWKKKPREEINKNQGLMTCNNITLVPKNRRFRNDHEYNCQIEWYMENLLKIDISMEKLIS